MHPLPGERHGPIRQSSSFGVVSFRCGCRASRRPGLRRAALRFGVGTFLSGPRGPPSAVHGLLDWEIKVNVGYMGEGRLTGLRIQSVSWSGL